MRQVFQTVDVSYLALLFHNITSHHRPLPNIFSFAVSVCLDGNDLNNDEDLILQLLCLIPAMPNHFRFLCSTCTTTLLPQPCTASAATALPS
jgi:hypothetical protein